MTEATSTESTMMPSTEADLELPNLDDLKGIVEPLQAAEIKATRDHAVEILKAYRSDVNGIMQAAMQGFSEGEKFKNGLTLFKMAGISREALVREGALELARTTGSRTIVLKLGGGRIDHKTAEMVDKQIQFRQQTILAVLVGAIKESGLPAVQFSKELGFH